MMGYSGYLPPPWVCHSILVKTRKTLLIPFSELTKITPA